MSEQEKISEQLSAYLDGELDRGQARRVERALKSDASMATELDRLRATRELLGRLRRERAPEDFVARVLAQAERRQLMGRGDSHVSGGALRWVRWAAAAAVLVIAFGIGGVIFVSLFTESFEDRIAGKGGPGRQIVYDSSNEKTDILSSQAPAKLRAGESKKLDREESHGKFANALEERPDDVKSGEIAATLADKTAGYVGKKAKALEDDTAPALRAKGGRLSKSAHDKRAPAELLPAKDLVIYTDDLPAAERDVVAVLTANSIKPTVVADASYKLATESAPADARGHRIRGRANYFYQSPAKPAGEKTIVVFAEIERVGQLESQLSRVRERQTVSQVPLAKLPMPPVTRSAHVPASETEARQLLEADDGAEPAAKPAEPAKKLEEEKHLKVIDEGSFGQAATAPAGGQGREAPGVAGRAEAAARTQPAQVRQMQRAGGAGRGQRWRRAGANLQQLNIVLIHRTDPPAAAAAPARTTKPTAELRPSQSAPATQPDR